MLLRYKQGKLKSVNSGFSFLELVIAIAIMALLAAVGIPMYMSYVEKAKITKTEGILSNLKLAINSYYLDTNKYPNSLNDLVKKPADAKKWRGPYLESTEIADDAWGNPFTYRPISQKGSAHPFELFTENPKTDERYSVWEVGK